MRDRKQLKQRDRRQLNANERRRLRPVLEHAETKGPIYRDHFRRGVSVLRKIVTLEVDK